MDRLLEIGAIGSESSVLEVGSGPGTYSVLLEPAVGSLTCLDSSEGMMERLGSVCGGQCILCDWNSYVPDGRFDCCISTLCPGSDSRESLERMEACAPERAVIQWAENHGDDIPRMIWNALGKEGDIPDRAPETVRDRLVNLGRDPTVEYFETRVVADIDVDDIVEMQRAASLARVEGDVTGIVEDMFGCGTVHFEHTNRIRMVRWTGKM